MKKNLFIISIVMNIVLLGITVIMLLNNNDLVNYNSNLQTTIDENNIYIEELEERSDYYYDYVYELLDENYALDTKLNNLYEEVYNMKEGRAYDFVIEINDELHFYKSGNGLFDGEKHLIVY